MNFFPFLPIGQEVFPILMKTFSDATSVHANLRNPGNSTCNINVTDNGEGVCVDPGERETFLGTGGPGPAPQKRERGSSWLQTVGEKGCSSMATKMGDGLAKTSRDGYAQSECYCALYSNCIV